MPKFTVVGDLHCTPKNLDLCAQLFRMVEDLGNEVILLGDVFDTKEIIRGKALNLVFDSLKASKLKWNILVGNHDLFNLHTSENSLTALKMLPNVNLAESLLEDERNLVFLPYIHDPEVLKSHLKSIEGKEKKYLFGHLELSDFDFGNGHICTTGLLLDDLLGFKRVISGHFHKYQTRKNLTYLGTPFSHSFGETNQVKYIGVLDTDTDTFQLIQTPFPKHLTVQVDCTHSPPKTEVSPQTLKLGGCENFYRVILAGPEANINGLVKTGFEGYNIKWISNPTDQIDNVSVLEETSSNESQFTEWAKNIKKMDPKTIELGLAILGSFK